MFAIFAKKRTNKCNCHYDILLQKDKTDVSPRGRYICFRGKDRYYFLFLQEKMTFFNN